MVVVLVVAVAGTPEVEVEVEVQGPAVAASKQVGSMVADWSQAELARAAVALGLAPCAPRMALRTLLAQDPGSRRSGDHRPGSLCTTADLLDP